MKVKIRALHPKDHYYPFRRYLEGQTGQFQLMVEHMGDLQGWSGGKVVLDKPFQLPNWKAAHADVILAFFTYDKLDDKPLTRLGPLSILWEFVQLQWKMLWK